MLPKIESLVSSLDEMEADVACITETWMTTRSDSTCRDVSGRTDYSFIERNRAGRRGGGVCIMYNRKFIDMTRCKLPDSRFEVVAAIGRRKAQRRKVLIIAAYLPPNLTAGEDKEFLDQLCDTILVLKNKYNDPYIMLGGDFNKRNLKAATRDYPEITPVITPPTRGTAILDIIATNMTSSVIEAGVTEPVHTQEGTKSDHKTVYATFRMPRVPNYELHKYSYIRKNAASLAAYDDFLKAQDWRGCLLYTSPSPRD